MSLEIQRQIVQLLPEAIALIALCVLMVAVWNVSRWITIKHYLKHHMADMVASELQEKTVYINRLELENLEMDEELKRNRITLKIIRGALVGE